MKKIILLFGISITLIVFMSSCGVDNIDISNYENEKITLSGLDNIEKKVTIKELSEQKNITEETNSTSDKIGTLRVTGTLLSTLVESYGNNLSDYKKVKIYGADDYEISLDKDFLDENKVILAIGVDGEPLSEDARPMRIIIPESDSAYWVRMVNKIEFIK